MKKTRLLSLLGFFFGMTMTVVLLICILGQNIIYRYRKEFLLDNYICVMLGVALYMLVLGIIHVCLRLKNIQKYIAKIMLLLAVVFTGVIFVMGYHYCFRTGWDVSFLLDTAEGLAYNQPQKIPEWYYSIYPNNILLAAIYTCIYKVCAWFGIGTPYFVLLFLQSVIFSWTGYIVYHIADLLFGKEKIKYTISCWVIYMGLVGVSPWVVIPYSDVAILFTVSLSVLLAFRIYKKGATVLRVFGFALCGMIGYYIKPQALIFLIAFGLIVLITGWRKIIKEFRHTFFRLSAVFAAYVVAFAMVQGATAFCGFDINKEIKYGITHFFMMGLNRESCGTISTEDVIISGNEVTYAARCRANMAEAFRRIDEMKIEGLADLAVKKTLINYNDGTFGWGVEGNFIAELYEIGNDFLRYFLRGFYYEGLAHYQLYATWMQVLWMGTLGLSIFSIKRIQDKRVATMAMAIVGLTLFELIFEARARYLFAYAPVYILLAVVGIQNITEFFQDLRKRRV